MKINRFTLILLITIAILLLAGFFFFPKKQETPSLSAESGLSEITIRNSKLYVEKASNEIEWSRGLSGRAGLNTDRGMMFVFPTLKTKIFWMKDTLIPLDIIWVANNKVVGIDHMLPELDTSFSLLKHYISPFPVDMAIETNLDWTTKNNIKVNDKISY